VREQAASLIPRRRPDAQPNDLVKPSPTRHRLHYRYTVPSTGSESSKLIILRGNSASGKSAVAAEIRSRYGHGLAIVGQDNLRRVVLREKDVPDGANIGLIDLTARYAS
jgi:hypothetical protein